MYLGAVPNKLKNPKYCIVRTFEQSKLGVQENLSYTVNDIPIPQQALS